ncbi:PTS galactosamine/N-acetylgalactosamine transporter subunit IIA [soil metagenome]
MSELVRGLIVAHSSLAEGMASAVRQIAGIDEDVISTLSNEGHGPEGLIQAVNESVGTDPVILFTDLSSGSCAFAARKISMKRPNTGIICGVNLAVLLDFVFHRDLPLTQLVERLVEKGRIGITGSCREEAEHADRALSS